MNRTLRPFAILALAAVPTLISSGARAATQADPLQEGG